MSLKSIFLGIFTIQFLLTLFVNSAFAQDFTINAISDESVSENVVYTGPTPVITGSPIGTLSYTISGGSDASSFTINSSSGVVSMVVRDYESPSDSNTDNIYEIIIRATDSDGNYAEEGWGVEVTDVTETVSFTINAIADETVSENAVYTGPTPVITGSPIGTLSYTISGGLDASSFTINSSTGVVSMVVRDYESPSDSNTDNIYELIIRATDSDGNYAEEGWSVEVTDLTETVSFTINAISDESVSENVVYSGPTPVITGSPIGTLSYTISGGLDASSFTINSSSGVVSMVVRDYESPSDSNTDNIYEIIIRATDSDGNYAEEGWGVEVTDVTETVSFTINAISDETVSENAVYTGPTPVITGSPIGTLSYTISGGSDASSFTINSSSGVVSMVVRDYESPSDSNTDNIYELIIRATDSDGNYAEEGWSVEVTDVTETVSFTINAISDETVSENVVYSGPTPVITGSPIGTLSYTISGGLDASSFTINSSSGVVSMVVRDYESPSDSNTDNIYELIIRATDSDGNYAEEGWSVEVTDVTETVSFTINAISDETVSENVVYSGPTPVITGSPIGTLSYTISGGLDASSFTINSSSGVVSMVVRDYESPSDSNTDNIYELIIRATDSDGNYAEEGWSVEVTDVTETVSFTINAISDETVSENVVYSGPTPVITGSPIGTLSYTISGGLDASSFTINSSSGVVSMVVRDYESPSDSNTDNIYELIIRATDSDGNYAEEGWSVEVTDVTETVSFTINAISDETVSENAVYSGPTPVITGSPIGTLSYTISGGSDASSFTINSSSGVVSMVVRDYESPSDSNTDNIYELIIRATDSDGNYAEEGWSVEVTDVTETVSFTINAISDESVSENVVYSGPTPVITGSPIGTLSYTISGGSDASSFTINSSSGVVSMVVRDYESPSDSNTDNIYELIIRATDSDGNYAEEGWSVEVTDVTETVSFTINTISDESVSENVVYSGPTPVITGSPIGTLSYTISGGLDASSFTINSSSGVVSMVVRDYESPSDSNTDNIYELIIRATDSDGNYAEEGWSVEVTDVTETVSFTINAISDETVSENVVYSGPTPVITGSPIGTLSYTISGGLDASSFTINSSSGVVSMVVRDYESPSDSNTDNIYELIIRATDSDGNYAEEGWSVEVTDVTETVSFTINTISDESVSENVVYSGPTPVITGSPIGTLSYTISGGLDASSFTINSSSGVVSMVVRDYESPSDSNTDNIYELIIRATDSDGNYAEEGWSVEVTDVTETVSFTINAISDETVSENVVYSGPTPVITGSPIGTLSYTISGGLDASSFTINSSSGVVSMVVRDYESPSDSNTDNIYELIIRATDSDGNYAEEGWSVSVLPVNDNIPVINVGSASFAENSMGIVLTATSTDGDLGDTETYSISGTDASLFTIDTSTGELTFNTSPDHENPLDDGGDNVYDLTITVTDGADQTDSQSVTVTVADVNDNSPVLTASNATVDENFAGIVIDASSTDVDTNDTETFSISGTDSGAFDIYSSTGVLTFKTSPDYENPTDANTDNVYELTITVTDGAGNTDSEDITVTILDVQETSTYSINSIANTSVYENNAYTSVTPTISGSPIGSLIYTLGGDDAADFSIDSSTGVVTMVARDYENPDDANVNNVYEVSITSTDSDNNSRTISWTVTVLAVNEFDPIISVSSTTVSENHTGTVVDASSTDADDSDSETYSISGTDSGQFTINGSTGVLTFNTSPDYENPLDNGGDNVYNLTVIVTDGAGHTDSEAITITVTNVNDNTPFAVSDGITVNEGGSTTSLTSGESSVLTNDSDLDDDNLHAVLVSNVSVGTLTLNDDGTFNYTHNDSETFTDSFTYQVNDGTINGNTVTVNITINPVNDNSPVISVSSISVNENQTGNILTASATDVDTGDTQSYSISGTDSGLFTMDSSTGVLTFNTSPDYENPLDNGGNNVYNLTVVVTDGVGHTDSQAITITVIDVTETSSYTIDAISNVSVNENTAYTSVTPHINGSPVGTVVYTLGGNDASDFSINSTTGVVSMVARDYENPVDANTNNVYELSISATDSDGNIASTAWSVTILPVNEFDPVITVSSTTVNENHTGTVIDASSTDADDSDSETYSISGTDASLFSINETTGVLTFNTSPDYENPLDNGGNNIYNITITVTDGAGHTDSGDVTVTVLNVTETSSFTINAISNVDIEENAVYNSVTPGITGSPVGSVTYTLGGNDASDFSINSSTGVVSMVARDFENPEDADANNVYEVSITATDQDNNNATTSWSVTVTAVNEYAPVISATSTTVNENHSGTVIIATSTDADDSDSETYSISGTDSGLFNIDNSSGVLTFQSSPDYENPLDNGGNNVYNLTITVTDDAGNDDSQSITITVANLNDNNPIGVDDYITVGEGGTVSILNGEETSVLSNDSDADGNSLTATLISTVSNGSLTLNSNGTFSYTNDGSETTSDSFTYVANDGTNNSNTVTVYITITGINDLPVIGDIPNQTIAEGGNFSTINLNNYISDAETLDEDILWTLDPTPTNIAIEIINGTATITPVDEEWNGVEVVTFVATDEDGASVYDNVRLEVTAINDAPEITGQNSISIAEETLTELSLSDLIVYDPDDNYPTGFTLTVLSGTNYEVTGTAITPNENVTGIITVQVYVTDDGLAQSNTYNLQVNVVNDNDPPVLIDIPNQTILEGSLFNNINLNNYVSDPDNTVDQISWTYSGNTDLVIAIDETSHVATIEIPNEDWFGQETVVFTASDGLLSASNSVVLTVTAVNDAPVINSQQSLSYNEDVVFTIPFTALNVTDVDNTYPSQHEMTLLSGSNYTFTGRQVTPEKDFNGTLIIPVYITDIGSENETSNTFNLSVTINAVNDAPQIESQINALSTNEDTPIVISLDDLNIIDPDNSSDDFSLSIQSGGNYTFNGTTVTPALNYYGTLSVDITVSDGESENSVSNIFTVEILVLAQNDIPEANNQSVTTPENQEISININNLISDVEDGLDLSSLKITSDVSNGTTSVDIDNTYITYNPNEGYSGSDSFTYEICDVDGACATGTITITVSNEAPTGVNDVVEVNEDNSISINVLSNDTDPQNNIDPNSLTIISQSQNGALTIQSEGVIIYTPNQDFFGEDEFEYQVCDEDGYCTSAHVAITVNSVNDQPVIISQNSIEISEDTSYTVTLNNMTATDVDNNYPSDFVLDVLSGDNYSVVGNTITPTLNFNGELAVNVIVDDQESENNVSDTYQFIITVTSVNDKPEILDQSTLITNEDEQLTISLNDLTVEDPDNNYPNDFILVVLAGLNYTVNNNVITPASNFYGYLNVPVYVSDQSDEDDRSRIFNLVVQVISQNDAPVTQNVNYSTSENVSLEIDMADLVTDVDGNIDYSSFENTTDPINGSINVDTDNNLVTYMPNEGYSGDDEFSFRFYDSEGLISNISYVYISVSNEAPNAVNDNVQLNEDESVVIEVLSNDTDPQNNIDVNSLVIVSNPVNGELSINSTTGEITYTPAVNFSGVDNFRYRIFDETGYSDDATVSLTIIAVNDIPVAVSDDAETDEDQSVVIDVLINDYDIDSDAEGYTVSISEDPQYGSVSVDSENNIVYTPNENYNGEDSFIYQLCDLEGGCLTAQVNIVIAPQNDAPIAVDDDVIVAQGVASTLDVLSNDSDIDDNLDITSLEIITEPIYGSYTIESLTGEVTYTSNLGYSGTDSFIYQICDTEGLCSTATVNISVSLQNVAPVCTDDVISMTDGATISFNVLDNDVDENGDDITVVLSNTSELGGFLKETSNGVFTYTSVYGNYCIEESFIYQGCDDSGNCDEATVKFIISVADTDGDNIADYIEEQHFNTDGDEFPDYKDEDSDNDGILDIVEGGVVDICAQNLVDSDNDGIPDYCDDDSDDDGITDLEEGSEDCDNDGIPNFKDNFDDCADRIDAPDTFSPNGDGVNDYFIIPGISDFEGNEIYIYNRWGGEVFHMKNYDNLWDGKSSNSAIGSAELPQGLYFYVVKLDSNKGVLKGSVYIKR